MKHELELSLQAWLDGELPEPEARALGEWIATDPEAAALLGELRCIKEALPSNDIERAVPATREFYWSQIKRQIESEAPFRRPARTPWFARWHGYLLPVTGLAALAVALVVTNRHPLPPTFDEISATSDVMEAVTYHDQSGQMTVVWLQDNNPQTAPEHPTQDVKSTTQSTDDSNGETD